MRRLVYWFAPLLIAAIASVVLGYGFLNGMRGDAGRALNTEEPDAAAGGGERSTGPLQVIVLGDSIARGTGDTTGLGIAGRLDRELTSRKISHRPTVTLGINGAKTQDLLAQIESANVRHILGSADVIVVSIGANDLSRALRGEFTSANAKTTMDEVLERVTRVVSRVREANPQARIYVVGLYNPFATTRIGEIANASVNQWNARLASALVQERRAVVLQVSDLFAFHDRLSADRYHPSGAGYELIARRIADSL